MISYSRYFYLPDSAKAAMATHAIDRMLDFLELLLIEGKFYTIFSVLFGVGFSILLSRASARGLAFHRFFLRRVFFLSVFGPLSLRVWRRARGWRMLTYGEWIWLAKRLEV